MRLRSLEPAMDIETVIVNSNSVSESIHALKLKPLIRCQIADVNGDFSLLVVITPANNYCHIVVTNHRVLVPPDRLHPLALSRNPISHPVIVPSQPSQLIQRSSLLISAPEHHHHVALSLVPP